ncbi:MAG: hypothetical protein QNJ97_17440 [Myxococcota bacterium]|nr:hypothetical protein [Myxococcota bacterium]
MATRTNIAAALLAGSLALSVSTACLSAKSGNSTPDLHTVVDVGFGMVDEDGFLLLLLEQGISWRFLNIRLSGPLRFRVLDRSPDDQGVLREQDWDEPSDFMKIPRSVTMRHEWDNAALDFRFGELSGVGIGHGTLVDAYFNSIDMDHYKGGAILRTEWLGNGLECLIENIITPKILVGRAFLAPLRWFSDQWWARRLEIGFTLGADIKAPYRVLNRSDAAIPVVAGDLSYRIIDTAAFVLMPYAALAAMDGDMGFHGGLSSRITLSKSQQLSLHLRGEYRRVTSDYHPAFFNPFYDYNRLFFPYFSQDSIGPIPTFADHLADETDPPPGNGLMLDGVLMWKRGLRIHLRYDREGNERPHWVMGRVDLYPFRHVAVGLFYAGQDITGKDGLFSTDALAGMGLRARIWGPLDAFAEFTRRLRSTADEVFFANEAAGGLGVVARY